MTSPVRPGIAGAPDRPDGYELQVGDARASRSAASAAATRIGVTGTRVIAPDQINRLRAQVATVLTVVREATWPCNEPSRPRPIVVSPLAEGADRLVAEEGLKAEYALVAPLPFAVDDYVRDFPKTTETFKRLLGKATVVELEGARGARETESYEEVGRYVVRHCDLLIAIWDGSVTGKRGGTAETTRFAAENKVPLWWLDANTARPARWIDGVADWDSRLLLDQQDADAALTSYLNTLFQ